MCSGWILFLQTSFDFLTSYFWRIFFCYSDWRYKSNGIFVLGVDFSFFRHISTIQLFSFDGIFLLFRLSIQSNGIIVLGVDFFLQTKFDFLNSHFWRICVCYSDFRYKSNGIFVLGVDFVFFRQVSTFKLAIFDGVFLLFRFSIQK